MVLITSVEVRLVIIFGWGRFKLDVTFRFLGLSCLISALFGGCRGLCLFFDLVTSCND
jgi:hypothetical protein